MRPLALVAFTSAALLATEAQAQSAGFTRKQTAWGAAAERQPAQAWPTTPDYQPPAKSKPPAFPTEDRFRPFQGQSTYSNRGGIDSYPKPKKPKGYISTY